MISATFSEIYFAHHRKSIGSITEERLKIKNANVLYIILSPLIISPPKNLFEKKTHKNLFLMFANTRHTQNYR